MANNAWVVPNQGIPKEIFSIWALFSPGCIIASPKISPYRGHKVWTMDINGHSPYLSVKHLGFWWFNPSALRLFRFVNPCFMVGEIHTTTGILMIVGEIPRLIELQSWRITSTLIVGKYDFWLRDYDNPNILASISLYKSSPNCWNIWVFLWSPSSWTVMFNWLHPTIVIRFESLYILYIYICLVVLTILKNMKVNGKDDTFHFPGAARHCARSHAAPKMLLTVQLPMVVGLDDVQGSENLSGKLGKNLMAALCQCLGQRMCFAQTRKFPLRWPDWGLEGTPWRVQSWIHRTRLCRTCDRGLLHRGCIDHPGLLSAVGVGVLAFEDVRWWLVLSQGFPGRIGQMRVMPMHWRVLSSAHFSGLPYACRVLIDGPKRILRML